MLTTSALHGVNAAFNYAVTTSTTLSQREMTFGHKSVIAVLSSAPKVARSRPSLCPLPSSL